MEINAVHPDITICGHTYGEYIDMVKAFHGHVAPGMILGGFMVDLTLQHRPSGEFFDAICETPACLPDAIQLLTPCTVGNSWLKIIDLGRFAMTMFEKYSGKGVRVYVDSKKIDNWTAIKTFLFKLTNKKLQDSEALIKEMEMAGTSILSAQKVAVDLSVFQSTRRRRFGICPKCGEGYPIADGEVCLGCSGKAPYISVIPCH